MDDGGAARRGSPPDGTARRGGAAALADRWAHGPAGRAAGRVLGAAAALLAPTDCVACGTPDAVLCPGCRAAVRAATLHPFAAEDGAESLPLAGPAGAPLPVVAAGVYRGGLAAAVLAFKDRGRTTLASVLGPALAGALRAAAGRAARAPGPDPSQPVPRLVLVPVPSRGAALRRRGYSPVAVLLGWIGRRGLLPPGTDVVPALRHAGGRSGSQKGRGRRARGALRGSLAPAAPVPAGAACLVVDDVLTTGATLAEAHRCLVGAGARVAGAVVLAAARPPRAAAQFRQGRTGIRGEGG